MPEVGQRYRRTRDKVIQRVLMKKTRCHVYYFHDQVQGVVGDPLGLGCSKGTRAEAVAFSRALPTHCPNPAQLHSTPVDLRAPARERSESFRAEFPRVGVQSRVPLQVVANAAQRVRIPPSASRNPRVRPTTLKLDQTQSPGQGAGRRRCSASRCRVLLWLPNSDASRPRQSARVKVTHGDGDRVANAQDINGHVTARARVIAELAPSTFTPTLDGMVFQQGAGGVGALRDRNCRSTQPLNGARRCARVVESPALEFFALT